MPKTKTPELNGIPHRLPRPKAFSPAQGDVVGWETGTDKTWIVGKVVEVVAPSDRPKTPVRVHTMRDHESYVVIGQLYVYGRPHNEPNTFWPRVGGLFPVTMVEAESHARA